MSFLNIFNRPGNGRAASSRPPAMKAPGEVRISAEVARLLDRLVIDASRFLPGHATGLRASARRRPQLEFREHRMYTPGDDVRFVDWKASARQEHIFIKQGEFHKEASIYILLDCSASMAWGEPPKSFTALNLAACLGYLAVTHGDRAHFSSFNQKTLQPLGPVSGKGQVPGLLKALRQVSFQGETDFLASGREFRRRYGHRPGLLLVISDFLNLGDAHAFLDLFPAPGWEVVFLHLLHVDEITPAFLGDTVIEDIETRKTVNLDITEKALATYHQRLEAWRSGLDLACVNHHAFFLPITAPAGSDLELVAHLRDRRLLKPL